MNHSPFSDRTQELCLPWGTSWWTGPQNWWCRSRARGNDGEMTRVRKISKIRQGWGQKRSKGESTNIRVSLFGHKCKVQCSPSAQNGWRTIGEMSIYLWWSVVGIFLSLVIMPSHICLQGNSWVPISRISPLPTPGRLFQNRCHYSETVTVIYMDNTPSLGPFTMRLHV